MRSRLRSTVGTSHKRLLPAAIQPASELSFALDPCSDYLLLGVSAVELDAPPGLISGSPIFLFFKFQTNFSKWHHFSSVVLALFRGLVRLWWHLYLDLLMRVLMNISLNSLLSFVILLCLTQSSFPILFANDRKTDSRIVFNCCLSLLT